MARQKGSIKLEGTIGNIIFYKRNGKYFARQKGGVDISVAYFDVGCSFYISMVYGGRTFKKGCFDLCFLYILVISYGILRWFGK